jgi:hypothetical protein
MPKTCFVIQGFGKKTDFQSGRTLDLDASYEVQQLALATYKSKRPSELEALERAKEILNYLWPRESLDPETLGLWAATDVSRYRQRNRVLRGKCRRAQRDR